MEEGEYSKQLCSDTCTNAHTWHTLVIRLNSWFMYNKSLLYTMVTLWDLAVLAHLTMADCRQHDLYM